VFGQQCAPVWTFSIFSSQQESLARGRWPDLPLCTDVVYALIEQFEFRFEIARFPHRLQAWQFSIRIFVLGLDEEVVQRGHLPAWMLSADVHLQSRSGGRTPEAVPNHP
jgi:hypothetical protein